MEQGKHGPKEAYEAQERTLMNVLRQLKFDSVLEIGAGYGRLTELVAPLLEAKGGDYLATDVSQDALDQIIIGVDAKVIDLDSYNPITPEFDLVLCAEVLMHRPEQAALEDLKHMWYNTRKYVVLVDWWEPSFNGEAPGCYMHDWSKLVPLDLKRIDIPEARQAIWIFTKKVVNETQTI